MKKIKISFSLILGFALFSGCQKQLKPDDVINNNVQPTASVEVDDNLPTGYEYYIDDVIVSQELTLDYNKDNVLVVAGSPSDPSDRVLRIRYYSSTEKKLAYAESQGMDLKKYWAVENHLSNYAESSGAIRYAEQYGEVPQSYIDYQSNYVAQTLGRKTASAGWYGKDWAGGQTLLYGGPGDAAFIPSWNNAISRCYLMTGIGIVYGWVGFYDKWFYSQKLFDVWTWTNLTLIFDDVSGLRFMDNKTSSVLHP